MPMGRAPQRRAVTPQQINVRLSRGNGGSSSGVTTMLQNGGGGGGSVVFAVEKKAAYYETSAHVQQQQHNNNNHGTDGGGGMGGPALLSTTASSDAGNLFSVANLALPQKSSRGGGSFWKRPMLHLLLSLVFGVVMGFTSLSWPDVQSVARVEEEQPRNLGLDDVERFASNLQTMEFRSEGMLHGPHYSSEQPDSAEIQSPPPHPSVENSRALQLEQIRPGSFELAPGLNYTLDPDRKLLIIVTPTYNRPFQAYYLTRLAHTLSLVPPPLLWLVVEMPFQTVETASVLMQTGIMYRHLVCRTDVSDARDQIVHQRNFALRHIEMHQLNGVVYFADDDNVYSQDLFEEMRKIRRFGTWPVAMLRESKAKTLYEGPVCDEDRVIGWHSSERNQSTRRFHASIAGFAFNSTILWDTVNWRHRSGNPIRQMDTVQEELQVTNFIEQLVEDEDQMHGLPSGCKKIMVWHLNMEAPKLLYPYMWLLGQPLFPNIPFRTKK